MDFVYTVLNLLEKLLTDRLSSMGG